MSENNTEQIQQAVQVPSQEPVNAQVPAEAPRKRIRVGYIFLSFVPVAVLVAIETIMQMPFLVLATVETSTEMDSSADFIDVMGRAIEIFNEKYSIWAYLLYSIAGLIVFGIWYYKGFVKGKPKIKMGEIFGVKSILASVGIIIGLQFVITAGFDIAYMLFPKVMEAYAEIMEASGLVDNVILTVVYGILLGPVIEELCLRGLCYGYLEKSGIKPFLVILISGLLFGIMHMNLVQGIYASVLGFFLGYLRYKYRSIKLTIAVHILFNLMGTYGSVAFDSLQLKEGAELILGGISLFILVFAVVLINGDKKAYRAE